MEDRNLIFKLSRTPNPAWTEEFRNQAVTQFAGSGPETAQFWGGDHLTIHAPSHLAPQQAEYVKSWIENANQLYKQRRITEAQNRRREMQVQLERELEDARLRLEVLNKIKL